jgi:hypothetical protein
MYVEMVCVCTASFSIDSDEDNYDPVWHLTYRFANAHVNCGYLTPGVSQESEEEKSLEKRIARKNKVENETELGE